MVEAGHDWMRPLLQAYVFYRIGLLKSGMLPIILFSLADIVSKIRSATGSFNSLSG